MHNSQNPTYSKTTNLTDEAILARAADILAGRMVGEELFDNPSAVKAVLQVKMAHYEREVFAALLLDSQHHLIEYQELFFGTIDASSVYPREVVKMVLKANAAAVIFAHNHPSGNPEPSKADQAITVRLTSALKLIDVRVLDHFVVGNEIVSFAERGLLANSQ